MAKKTFVEVEMFILTFGKNDVITTSSFDGFVDVFDDEGMLQ